MIEAGGPSTGGLGACFPKSCARPTRGSHGLTTGDSTQRFKGAKRRAEYGVSTPNYATLRTFLASSPFLPRVGS